MKFLRELCLVLFDFCLNLCTDVMLSIESTALFPWQFINSVNTKYDGTELFNETRYSIVIFLIISYFLRRKFKFAC